MKKIKKEKEKTFMPKRRKEFVDDLLTRYEEAIVTCTFLSINFQMAYYKFRTNICSSVLATIPKGNPPKKKKRKEKGKRENMSHVTFWL